MWRLTSVSNGLRTSAVTVLKRRLPGHRCQTVSQKAGASSKVGSWVPVIAVGGGAIGVVVGALSLAAVNPSFQQFLEKQFPAVKPVLSSLWQAKKTTPNSGVTDNGSRLDVTHWNASGEADKVTGQEIVSCSVDIKQQEEEKEEGTALDSEGSEDGLVVEEVDNCSSQEMSQLDMTEKAQHQSADDGGETAVGNTAISSPQEAEDWVDDVNETLKTVCVDAADRAVSQQHRLQQCLKKKMGIIHLALTDAMTNEDKQKEIDQKLMDAQSKVEMASDEALDGLKLFENTLNDLQRHLETLQEANRQQEALRVSELILNLKFKVQQSQIKVTEAQSELALDEEYRAKVETSQRRLEYELKELAPSGAVGVDVPLLLHYADRHIEKLREELREQERKVHETVAAAVQQQKEVDTRTAESKLQAEIERLKSEHGIDMEQMVCHMRQECEVDKQEQLHRQASLYHEHADSLLIAQKEKLEKQYGVRLRLERQSEHAKQQAVLDVTLAKLLGIESVIDAMVKVDREQQTTKELYRACQLLQGVLHRDNGEHSKPLKDEVEKVKRFVTNASVSHPLLERALQSIPKEALLNGVPLENTLQWRFDLMRKACQRVALIDDDGGNVFQYLLSYLHSFFRLETKVNVDHTVTPEGNIDTFRHVTLAEHFVSHGDLESAARLINQLQGEPRRVATDWLADVRLFLETKQAVSLVCAYALLAEL